MLQQIKQRKRKSRVLTHEKSEKKVLKRFIERW